MDKLKEEFVEKILFLLKIDDEMNFYTYLKYDIKIETPSELTELIKLIRNHKLFDIRYIIENKYINEDMVRTVLSNHLNELNKGNLLNITDIILNELLYIVDYFNIKDYDDLIKKVLKSSIPVTTFGYMEEIHDVSVNKLVDENIFNRFMNN